MDLTDAKISEIDTTSDVAYFEFLYVPVHAYSILNMFWGAQTFRTFQAAMS